MKLKLFTFSIVLLFYLCSIGLSEESNFSDEGLKPLLQTNLKASDILLFSNPLTGKQIKSSDTESKDGEWKMEPISHILLTSSNDATETETKFETSTTNETENPTFRGKRKSPFFAFLCSFIVPGTGEYYVNSKNLIRPAVFIGIEAVSWGTWYYFRDRGFKIRKDYEAFARKHYNIKKYIDYRNLYTDATFNNGRREVIDSLAIDWIPKSAYNGNGDIYFLWYYPHSFNQHSLPGEHYKLKTPYRYVTSFGDTVIFTLGSEVIHEKPGQWNDDEELPPIIYNQQYYEDIGKYPQYIYGWDDFEGWWVNIYNKSQGGGLDSLTTFKFDSTFATVTLKGYIDKYEKKTDTNRYKYLTMRKDSNDNFKRAKLVAGVIMLNHLMSGFDAFNLARRYNENLAVKESRYKLEFSYQNTQNETVGYAILKMKY